MSNNCELSYGNHRLLKGAISTYVLIRGHKKFLVASAKTNVLSNMHNDSVYAWAMRHLKYCDESNQVGVSDPVQWLLFSIITANSTLFSRQRFIHSNHMKRIAMNQRKNQANSRTDIQNQA